MRTLIALAIGRAVRKLIRTFRHGGGSAVPGTVASKIQPKLFETAISNFPMGLVVVSGSSGKSSTTKFLVQILQDQGLKVFTNPSTANIKQGLFSAVLQGAKGFSLPKADIAVIEMDEAYALRIGAPLKPALSVITNVMDEQLDRFTDSEYVLNSLQGLASESKKVIANGNDPKLSSIGNEDFLFFGFDETLVNDEGAPRYAFSVAKPVSKLDYEITKASPFWLKTTSNKIELELSDRGLHMVLNFAASVAAALELLPDFDRAKLATTATNLEGVFGRDTLETIDGVESRILLVQNRESFRLNLLRAKNAEQLFMAIGTDVKDPSWLWGVDFKELGPVDILTGHHAIPMKYRLQSCGIETRLLENDFDEALQNFLEFEKPTTGERIFIVTADTLRRMKRSLELGS